MCEPMDLARVGLTDHAVARWAERIGLPGWHLRRALVASRPANRRLRRRVREGCRGGRWHRLPTFVRVDRATGAVFVIGRAAERSSGHGSPWIVVTVLPLDACRVCPEVAEVEQEDTACPAATA